MNYFSLSTFIFFFVIKLRSSPLSLKQVCCYILGIASGTVAREIECSRDKDHLTDRFC